VSSDVPSEDSDDDTVERSSPSNLISEEFVIDYDDSLMVSIILSILRLQK